MASLWSLNLFPIKEPGLLRDMAVYKLGGKKCVTGITCCTRKQESYQRLPGSGLKDTRGNSPNLRQFICQKEDKTNWSTNI